MVLQRITPFSGVPAVRADAGVPAGRHMEAIVTVRDVGTGFPEDGALSVNVGTPVVAYTGLRGSMRSIPAYPKDKDAFPRGPRVRWKLGSSARRRFYSNT